MKSYRLKRFLCWLWYNHSGVVPGHSCYTCEYCNKRLVGSD